MTICHELSGGTKGVFRLNHEKFVPILNGNPVFTTTSSETMNPINKFLITSKIIR